MPARVSQCVRRVWERAKLEMRRQRGNALQPEQELLALVCETSCIAVRALKRAGIDLGRLRAELADRAADRWPFGSPGTLFFPRNKKHRPGKDSYLSTRDLLCRALDAPKHPIHQLIARQGLDAKSLRLALMNVQDKDGSADGGVVTVASMDPMSEGVMEQIERLKSEHFQANLREVAKFSGLIETAPILWNVPPEELERQAGAAVPELLALLADPKSEVRWAAATALGRFGSAAQPALPALVACLQQDEEFIREASLTALTQIDRAGYSWSDQLDGLLKHVSPRLRLAAMRARWALDQDLDAVLPVLEDLLVAADPHVCGQTASFVDDLITGADGLKKQALVMLGQKGTLRQIAKAMQRRKVDAGRVHRLLPAMIRGLSSNDYQVRQRMAQLLAHVGPAGRSAIPALMQALRNRDRCQRPWFAGKAGHHFPWSQLLGGLLGAALVAVAANAEEVPAELSAALDDADPVVRAAAAAALGAIGPAARPAIPRLQARLTDSDAVVRVQAAGALWRLDRRTDVVNTLVDALKQPGEAAQAATKLLAEMGPDAAGAFPSLLHTVETQSGVVRPGAALALFRMGYQVDAVAPILREGVASDDPMERVAAAVALQAVDPKSIRSLGRENNSFEHLDLDVPDEEAVALWSDAIQADPEDAQAYLLRGLARLQKDDLANGLADLDRASQIDPRCAYASVYFERGNARVRGGEMNLAIADYTEAIRLDPEYAIAYGNRGEAHRRKGDLDRALEDLDHALRLDPDRSNALNSRAIVFKNQGKYAQAIADYTESIRLNPHSAMAFVNRGMAYKAKGEFHKAIADYEVAMRVDPAYMNGHNNLAWLLATCPRSEIRDGKKALDHAKRACELTGWQRAECLGTLGAAYAEMGNFVEALHWQEKALEFPEYRLRDGVKAEMRLQLYRDGKPFREEISPDNANPPGEGKQ